jgi:hypothetical protein
LRSAVTNPYGARVLRALISCAVLSAATLFAPVAARADDPPADPAPAEVLFSFGLRAIAQTSVTVSARVDPHGLPTKAHLEYGTTPETTQSTPDQDVPAGAQAALSFPLTGLTPGTHYYVVAHAENAQGGDYGSMIEFDTTRQPSLAELPVTDIGPLSATLHVGVTGYGLPVTLTGTLQPFTAGAAPIALGPVTVTADGDAALPLTGLSPSTNYRWTVTASSAGGNASASRAGSVFATARLYDTPRPKLAVATAVYGAQVAVTGTLAQARSVPVSLQSQALLVTAPFAAVPGAAGVTDALGNYAFTVTALHRARYGVVAAGYAVPDRHNAVELRVAAAMTRRVTRARRHRSVVSGTYRPDVPGKVALFRVGHGRVGVAIAARKSGPGARAFRFAARVLKPGRYEVRLAPAASAGIEPTRGARFTIR